MGISSSTVTEVAGHPYPTLKMMKLAVFAMAMSAACAGVVPLTYSGLHGAYGIHGAYSGLGVHGLGLTAYSGLPVSGLGVTHGVYSGLPVSTLSHSGYSVSAGEEVRPVVPVTYSAAPAPAIVAPQPYSVHTGTKVEAAAEPVEQHGYVIKY